MKSSVPVTKCVAAVTVRRTTPMLLVASIGFSPPKGYRRRDTYTDVMMRMCRSGCCRKGDVRRATIPPAPPRRRRAAAANDRRSAVSRRTCDVRRSGSSRRRRGQTSCSTASRGRAGAGKHPPLSKHRARRRANPWHHGAAIGRARASTAMRTDRPNTGQCDEMRFVAPATHCCTGGPAAEGARRTNHTVGTQRSPLLQA